MVNQIDVINICKHELGHWFTAQQYGFDADHIEIKLSANQLSGLSSCTPRPDLPTKQSILDFLKKRISVLLAGVVSETHKRNFSKNQVQELYSTTAAVDVEKMYILLHIVRGIQYSGKIHDKNMSKHLDTISDECWMRADEIIERNSEKINYIATRMASKIDIRKESSYRFDKKNILTFIQEFKNKKPEHLGL
ncbi:hypothetical protein [Aeromonas hydrophila]|uniref:hypothetical protein n=1 Tax=Aeromonas hydrophila TaxID=644 RepID=UPI000B3348A4|nr:hypothetical protein [Aeromonas hydrophila]